MDGIGHVGHGRTGVERERLLVRRAVLAQPHADQAGQAPRPRRRTRRGTLRPAPKPERRGDRGRRAASRSIAPGGASSACVAARNAGLSIPAAATSARTASSSVTSPVRANAVHDRVGATEHAEQRPATATVVRGALDEPRDLHELDKDAPDPGQRRHRAERRERVVAGLDLDLGQRLEKRRLPDVRRPHEAIGRRLHAGPRSNRGGRRSRERACPRSPRGASCAGPRTDRSCSRAVRRAARARRGSARDLRFQRAAASPPGRTCGAASA